MSGCPIFSATGPTGIADALRSVDCMAGQATAQAFARLFGPSGALGAALTLLLTLYVAWLAIGLITGRATLSLSALTPRMMGLGLVLTFATSWVAYQSVVWTLAAGAPDQLASLLLGTHGSASYAFADRLDALFQAIADAAQAAQDAAAATTAKPASFFTPADLLWLGALMLLLGTVGVLIVAKISLAALLALGPVFILLALFPGTRGLFEGWLKGVVLLALVPLVAVLIGGSTLAMIAPLVASLGLAELSMRMAVTVFLAASVYCALIAMALKVATTLTSGWRIGFAQAPRPMQSQPAGQSAAALAGGNVHTVAASSSAAAAAADRVRAITATLQAANDSGSIAPSERTRIVTAGTVVPSASSAAPAVASRVRGLGQTFRAPAASARFTEKQP